MKNAAVVVQQKIKLLLLHRSRSDDKTMNFLIAVSPSGRVEVAHKYLPSDTPLRPICVDCNGFSTVGYLNIPRSLATKTDNLYLPLQTETLARTTANKYGYESAFGYKHFWMRGSLFSSYECEEQFPYSASNDNEVFRAVIAMVNLFSAGVLGDEDDEADYFETVRNSMCLDDEEYMDTWEDVRCTLEDTMWVAENVYNLYKRNWSLKKISYRAEEFIKENILFYITDSRFKRDVLSRISDIIRLFIVLEQEGRDSYLEHTLFSLIKIEKAGMLMDYFKKHPRDERNQRFLNCISYFNRFHSSGDYEFEPIWCRDSEKNLYIYFLSGRDLEGTTEFDEMDPDFLVAMKEIQLLCEEIL